MGRGKKKRSAAQKNKRGEKPLPKAAPLVVATVFGGSYSLKVPQGWMHPAEVLASGLDARPSEQFVSRRALSGPGFATLMVDLAPANIRDLGGPSGRQRLKEFLRYQEEENDVTLDSADEFKCSEPPFEHAWLVEYRSVGKLQGRTTETTAILMTSPEADMILRLNNGDAENVDWAPIVASLRRNSQVPLPQPTYPSNWPTEAEALSRLLVPETIKLDLDELRAVVNDRDRDAKILWMVAQAMCYGPAELASMDAATVEKVHTLRKSAEFTQYRCAAFEVPAVRRRIEDERRAALGCIEDMKRARAASEKGPRQAASEPVEDLRERARRIEVAAAVCNAAVRAAPPHEKFSENGRSSRALQNLRDAITTDDSDRENFLEYMQSRHQDKNIYRYDDNFERLMKCMMRWTRLRKYWPRLRRRICVNCGACIDLSKPRFLVCGGCAEGRGVGRYCSETCQAEHWPTHQDVCPRIDHVSVEARPWLRKMQNFTLIDAVEKATSAGHSPEEYLEVVANGLAEQYGTIDKMNMELLSIEFVSTL